MPNVIKYTTGATETGCLRKGNMQIGNNTADYGSTFYSAIEPPPDGYTIYLNKANGGPSIYVANNDSELITLTNQIANTSYTTVDECLIYFTSQSDKLIVSSNDVIPSVITDGLVLSLDASNISSYPTTGTTWYDLSGNANNGTLNNGVEYTTDNGDALIFDGTNDYGTATVSGLPVGASARTVSIWVRVTGTTGNPYYSLCGYGNQSPSQTFDLGFNDTTDKVFLDIYGAGGITSVNTINKNQWYMVTGIYTGTQLQLYINDNLEITNNYSLNTGNTTFKIADTGWTYPAYLAGNIGGIKIYNRALSADEVLQNYNAQFALGTKLNPADSAVAILSSNPGAPDGYYWINTNLGPRKLHCLMSLGGWMGMTSELCPQITNIETSGSWETNTDGRLQRENFSILNVNVVEGGCGNVKSYQLQNPSNVGLNYTQKMLLIERVSTIGQCSDISNGTGNGYYPGPEYQGSYTSAGMCTWGDGNFANACCGAQNMTGLQKYWVMLGEGTNPNLYYQVQCAGGSGQHYHMWYIK